MNEFDKTLNEEFERINLSSLITHHPLILLNPKKTREDYEIVRYTIKNLVQLIIIINNRLVEIENNIHLMNYKIEKLEDKNAKT